MAVLARSWGAKDEAGWALRQVAGALACIADVHVITPQGVHPRIREDGACTVHELASAPDPVLEARRDVLVEAIVSSRTSTHDGTLQRPASRELTASVRLDDTAARVVNELVSGQLAVSWQPGVDVLRELAPDRVVVADYRQAGVVAMLDRACPAAPVIAVPFGMDPGAMALSAFAPLFERAETAVVFTESEMRTVKDVPGNAVAHKVGLPMSANRSLLREPNASLRDRQYVLVLSGEREDSPELSGSLARLLRARFARKGIAVAATDSFTVSLNGITERPEPVERGSDLVRLIAWARATVDLSPGPLFARRCLESLLYATPIVVPAHSRAREHAERGGGLWFEGPTDLAHCVEAMFDPAVSDSLGRRGRLYAERLYGSTDAFIDKVMSATGFDATSVPRPGAK